MDKKISQLSSLSTVSGNEAIPIAKAGANYKVSTTTLKSGLATTESIPSKLSALTNDNNTVTDSNYVHTDNNYTSTEKSKLSTLEGLPEGGESGQYLVKDANNNASWLSPTSPVDIMDLVSYGVEWDITVADPKCTRIGNPELHRTLPIQSAYRGCIAQGKKILYYLDANDWRLKQRHDTANVLEYTADTITITDGSVLVADQWVKLNDTTFGQVTSVTDNTATIKWEDTPTFNSTNTIIIGSRLNGYDGEVMVHIPRFYYRSWIDGNKRRVRVSTIKVDGTWIENPEMLVGAYRSTVLNTVPENMGYLSTLQVNSAISVVNNHDYCRGGGNRSDYDVYADTDQFRSDLCKPRTSLSRSNMRTYARNAGHELLCYDYYKTVFYWLYVIEYANFNSQDTFNSELTSDGYRQGGLGTGITTVNSSIWEAYNSYYPLTTCGYGNDLGNNTGIKPLIIPEIQYTSSMPRWRGFDNVFGDILTNVDGVIIQGIEQNDGTYVSKNVYTTTDSSKFGDSTSDIANMKISGIETYSEGYIKSFDMRETAEIIPATVGGSATTYKCDQHYSGNKDASLRQLRVGGTARDGGSAGLGYFNSTGWVSAVHAYVGFRTLSVIQ